MARRKCGGQPRPNGPSSDDLERILADALSQPLPWRQRLVAWLRQFPSTLARMGGYWGGVTMRWRDKP